MGPEESSIEVLKQFKVLFAGGPLPTAIGNKLVEHEVNLAPLTEAGAISIIMPRSPPNEGWEWCRTSPNVDIVFSPVSGLIENAYRLIVKKGFMKTPAIINTLIDGMEAFDTNDLVERHSTNPTLWKILGREEDLITRDHRILHAIMFGRSKFQPGIILVPAKNYSVGISDKKSSRRKHSGFAFRLCLYVPDYITAVHTGLRNSAGGECQEPQVNTSNKITTENLRWQDIRGSGECILKFRSGNGEPPLIVLHGGTGTARILAPLQDTFNSAVWAVQVAPDAPMSSVYELAMYYYGKIKEHRPFGPYRLAAYSASTVLIDHFPTLYLYGLEGSEPTSETIRRIIEDMCRLLVQGKDAANTYRVQVAEQVLAELNGLPSSPTAKFCVSNMEKITRMSIRFLQFGDTKEQRWSKDELYEWMRTINAPLTVCIASAGVIQMFDEEHRSKASDLGSREVFPSCKTLCFEGSHIDIISNKKLAEQLEHGFV
ncbi:hypothetical protein BDQ17DRAFT_1431859 [Cyathus striatus]|nr:hypothetical protein BDQ17DRAFT_1431859 [Cyathus striatus]